MLLFLSQYNFAMAENPKICPHTRRRAGGNNVIATRATTPSQRRQRRLRIGSDDTITTRVATQGQRMCVLLFLLY
jgi:hypothetical protein